MWRGINATSLERCSLDQTATGHRLAGTTLLALEGVPYDIRYTVIVDGAWRPTTIGINVQGPENDRALALSGDGEGNWSVGDAPVIELFGATAVHLGWSPAAHTLTLQQLDLEVGDTAQVTALRIGFPERDITRVMHHYERLAPRRYRFASGDYSTDLTINEHQFVTVQPGRWTTEAEA
jgi:hypothetical protein